MVHWPRTGSHCTSVGRVWLRRLALHVSDHSPVFKSDRRLHNGLCYLHILWSTVALGHYVAGRLRSARYRRSTELDLYDFATLFVECLFAKNADHDADRTDVPDAMRSIADVYAGVDVFGVDSVLWWDL